jgi:hypothetical protein
MAQDILMGKIIILIVKAIIECHLCARHCTQSYTDMILNHEK